MRFVRLAALVFAASITVAHAETLTSTTTPPLVTPQTLQPNTPTGQQIGVTNLPAPVILQSAPTAKLPLGDYAGEILTWVVTTFGATIGAALTALLVKMLQNAGVQGAGLLRDKLDEIIVNGLNIAAKEAAAGLQGRGQVEVKNEIVRRAVQYAQAHAADTLKALGADPASAAAIEAIKARIETAIADPSVPTPAILDGKTTTPANPAPTPPTA